MYMYIISLTIMIVVLALGARGRSDSGQVHHTLQISAGQGTCT